MTQTPQTDPAKLAAARAAVALVRDGMKLGLGTGSTAAIMVRESGMITSMKNFTGPAPSMRAASSNSSGMDLKNCLK